MIDYCICTDDGLVTQKKHILLVEFIKPSPSFLLPRLEANRSTNNLTVQVDKVVYIIELHDAYLINYWPDSMGHQPLIKL